MGFSVTATHAIFFIASVAIAAGLAGVANDAADLIKSSVQQKSQQTSDKLLTGVRIVHVNANSTGTYTYVINSGKTVLNQSAVSIFIDESYVSSATIGIVNRSTNINNNLWDPQEVIEIATSAVSSGRHTAKVVTQHGVSDESRFNR